MKILVTGGAGFIGSAFIRYILTQTEHSIVNVDKLTYAGNLSSLKGVDDNIRYSFYKADICNKELLSHIFLLEKPDSVIHLAAESHVDRSINDANSFMETNIIGTYQLLEVARHYLQSIDETLRTKFRFLHVSTDEVYGDLDGTDDLFTEETSYDPSSPYSASKAAADHLVSAWGRTYDIPILLTNCSNNYGAFQYPEKLIPVIINKALAGEPIPIYGDGNQVRDWLYVDDHVKALYQVLTKADVGSRYNVGGFNEIKNIDIVKTICAELDRLVPCTEYKYAELITFVEDRAGHDRRYAIDASLINRELGWQPLETFESGIKKTIEWYLDAVKE